MDTETITFTSLLCGIILLLLMWYLAKNLKYYRLSAQLPTIFGLPFVGVAFKFIPYKNFLPTLDKYFAQLRTSTYLTWIGFNPFVITIDPDIIERVFTSSEFLNKSHALYAPIDHAIPDGLITSTVTKWQHNRKLLHSSFTNKILISFIPIFNKGSKKAIIKLDELVGPDEHKIFDLIKRVILEVGLETTMGIQIEDDPLIGEKVLKGFNYLIEKSAHGVILNCMILSFLIYTPTYYKTKNFLTGYVKKLIKIKLAENKATSIKDNFEDSITKSSCIFIDQAIGFMDSGKFGQMDIVRESHTMIAASFETTTTTIFSVLVFLAMHPNVQEKLFEEVLSVFPNIDSDVELEHLKKLPYMDRVINETLRLAPSVPVIGRQVERDTQLTPDIMLPAGTQITIPIFNLQRRKDIWGPAAHVFDPDNFLPENLANKHAYAYIPFSKGPRGCIGWRYAEITLRINLIRLLRNFKYSTSFKYTDLEYVDYISIRYNVEPTLKIERRMK